MAAISAIYVYGFCLLDPRPPVLPQGIGGATEWIAGEAIGAIAEMNLDLLSLQGNDDRLLQAVVIHDQVLQTIFDSATVLPLRFGTQFSDLAALQRYLQEQGRQHESQLVALQGRAEYVITAEPLVLEMPPLAPDLKGREYFLAKKRRLQEQGEHQQQQHQEWGTVLEYWQTQYPDLQLGDSQAVGERIYLLADRGGQQVASCLAQAQEIAPHWILHASYPLPPYHFIA